jgi:YtxH-like protein
MPIWAVSGCRNDAARDVPAPVGKGIAGRAEIAVVHAAPAISLKAGYDMNTKFLVSLGSTLAASRLAQSISNLETDDVLRVVGLSRRRSYFIENLALVGAGALAGAAVALLLAPASGTETRERMALELGRVKDSTLDALRDAKRQAPGLLNQLKDTAKNEMSSSSAYNT